MIEKEELEEKETQEDREVSEVPRELSMRQRKSLRGSGNPLWMHRDGLD